MKYLLKKLFFKLINKSPADMPMVRYWKFKESVQAKVMKAKDGSLIMKMEGEDYPFPGFPRGYLLFGALSKLKHEIKNQLFNESWWKLEAGENRKEIIRHIKEKLKVIYELAERYKYDMLPPESMSPAVKEIYRAWPERGKRLRDILCFILQEDDGYRFRVQDLAEYFDPNKAWKRLYRFVFRKSYLDSVIKDFEIALTFVEHCEVIGDMKERIRLLRRILLLILEDEDIKKLFEEFCKKMNWKKIYLKEGDKYHFRGKYYKCDYRLFEY